MAHREPWNKGRSSASSFLAVVAMASGLNAKPAHRWVVGAEQRALGAERLPKKPNESEAESFSSVTEQCVKRRPIQAQSTAIARAMARICNDERASFWRDEWA